MLASSGPQEGLLVASSNALAGDCAGNGSRENEADVSAPNSLPKSRGAGRNSGCPIWTRYSIWNDLGSSGVARTGMGAPRLVIRGTAFCGETNTPLNWLNKFVTETVRFPCSRGKMVPALKIVYLGRLLALFVATCVTFMTVSSAERGAFQSRVIPYLCSGTFGSWLPATSPVPDGAPVAAASAVAALVT